MKSKANIIEITWDGPFSLSEIINNDVECQGMGLYQIYGLHPIYGQNSLLYIGYTIDSYTQSIPKHNDGWIKFHFDEVKIYLGRIENEEDSEEAVKKKIVEAQRLLVYYCAPAYNAYSDSIYKGEDTGTIVLNFGKISCLPIEVSTFWYYSETWEKE
ncbi:MAG: hypothetical protein ABIJ16_03795 [Bacteroidota bacterium]